MLFAMLVLLLGVFVIVLAASILVAVWNEPWTHVVSLVGITILALMLMFFGGVLVMKMGSQLFTKQQPAKACHSHH